MSTYEFSKNDCTIVIPAYNEEKNIRKSLKKIWEVMNTNKLECKTIVIDDGSSDDTNSVCREFQKLMPIYIINHKTNMGLPLTMRDGLKKAIEITDSKGIIITMDGDNTFSPEQIPQMINEINKGYDIVIMSRYVKGAKVIGVPFKRKLLSYFANLLLQLCLPMRGVKDYSCGFRAFKKRILEIAFLYYGDKYIEEKGFSVTPAILLKLRRFHPYIRELPIILSYNLKIGKSKIKLLKTIFGYFNMIFRNVTTQCRIMT